MFSEQINSNNTNFNMMLPHSENKQLIKISKAPSTINYSELIAMFKNKKICGVKKVEKSNKKIEEPKITEIKEPAINIKEKPKQISTNVTKKLEKAEKRARKDALKGNTKTAVNDDDEDDIIMFEKIDDDTEYAVTFVEEKPVVKSANETAFVKEMKRTNHVLLNKADDIYPWITEFGTVCKNVGLSNIINQFVKASVDKKKVKCSEVANSIVKQYITTTVKLTNYHHNQERDAQESLWEVLNSAGLIKNISEMIELEMKFTIDLRKSRHEAIANWNKFKWICVISNYETSNKRIITFILKNLPSHGKLDSLKQMIEGMKLGNCSVSQTISAIFDDMDKHSSPRPFSLLHPGGIDAIYQESNTNRRTVPDDSDGRVAGITRSHSEAFEGSQNQNNQPNAFSDARRGRYQENNQGTDGNDRGNGGNWNRRGNDSFNNKRRKPSRCVICGDTHATDSCPRKKAEGCWFCGDKTHLMRGCLRHSQERVLQRVNSLWADRQTRELIVQRVNAARGNGDDSARHRLDSSIVLDTGAQVSVTDDLNLLQFYMELGPNETSLQSVTNNAIEVLGVGSLILKLIDQECKIIEVPVLHCKNVHGTYISDDDLLEKGVEYRSINGKPYLCWGHDQKVALIRDDKLIHIPQNLYTEDCRVNGVHEALGHVDHRAAERSVQKGSVRISIEEQDQAKDKCYNCQLAKARKCDHKKGSRDPYIVKQPFYLMHSDVLYMGTSENEDADVPDQMGEYHWAVSFTCDYTKMCYSIVMKRKSEVTGIFKRLRAYIKTMFGIKIAILHSDQGTEYINQAMREFMQEKGITLWTTTAHTSEENGVAERRNLTIRNDVRANLESSGLDDKYWIYALEYTCSLRNKISATGDSPEEKVMKHCRPEQEVREIYPIEFKRFGMMGTYLDLSNSNKSSTARRAIPCFYLGPSVYPLADRPGVLGGDKVLVYMPTDDGYHKPVVKHSTHVKYTVPPKVFKDIKLSELGIQLQPTQLGQPTPAANPTTRDIFAPTPRHIFFSDNTNMLPGTGIIDFNEPDLPHTSLGGIIPPPPTIESASTTCETLEDTDKTQDSDVENFDAPDSEDKNESHVKSTATASTTVNENVDKNNETVLDEMSTEFISTSDINRVRALENNMTVDEIIAANAEPLKEYRIDKELLPTGSLHGTIALPEGRALRSRVRIPGRGIFAVKLVANVSKGPGALPEPTRLIYQIVSKDPIEGPGWVAAFQSEWESHITNGSWSAEGMVTSDPKILRKTVKLDVICNLKRAAEGQPQKKKVRFVLRGDRQDDSTYTNTFSPTLPYDILRIILAECVQSNRHFELLDISTAYLNATIDHEIYVELPQVLETHSKRTHGDRVVHKVNKAIYGLKQSGRLWYMCLVNYLKTLGFEERGDVPCVLIKTNGDRITMIVGFFVDDMIITGDNKKDIDKFTTQLNQQFTLKITKADNSGWKDILGIAIKDRRDSKTGDILSIDLCMASYTKKMVQNLGLEKEFKKAKYISTPMTPNFQFDKDQEMIDMTEEELAEEIHWFREVVGSLQYLAMTLRPDIAYAANYMSRFCLFPHPKLKNELLRILRYAYKTRMNRIRYTRFETDIRQMKDSLITYSDADHAGDLTSRKSTLSAIFMMSGGPIAWFARVAKFAATSSTDAEVAAMVESGNGVTHYREVLCFLGILNPGYSRRREYFPDKNGKIEDKEMGEVYGALSLEPLVIHVDNIAAIYLAEKGTTTGRSKHMGIRVARANDIIENEHVTYKHIGTKDMLADILTKPVSADVMKRLVPRILVTGEATVRNT